MAPGNDLDCNCFALPKIIKKGEICRYIHYRTVCQFLKIKLGTMFRTFIVEKNILTQYIGLLTQAGSAHVRPNVSRWSLQKTGHYPYIYSNKFRWQVGVYYEKAGCNSGIDVPVGSIR